MTENSNSILGNINYGGRVQSAPDDLQFINNINNTENKDKLSSLNDCGAKLKESKYVLIAGVKEQNPKEIFKFSQQDVEFLLSLPPEDVVRIFKSVGVKIEELKPAGADKFTEKEFTEEIKSGSARIFKALEKHINKSECKGKIINKLKALFSLEFKDALKNSNLQWFFSEKKYCPVYQLFKIFGAYGANCLNKYMAALCTEDFKEFCAQLKRNGALDPFANIENTLELYFNVEIHTSIESIDGQKALKILKKYFPCEKESELVKILDWFIPFTDKKSDVVLNSAYIPKPTAEELEKNAEAKSELYFKLMHLCKFTRAEYLAYFLWKSDADIKKLIQNFDTHNGKYLTQKYALDFKSNAFNDFINNSMDVFNGLDELKITAKEADDFIGLFSKKAQKTELPYCEFKEFIKFMAENDINIKLLKENNKFKIFVKNSLTDLPEINCAAIKNLISKFYGKNDKESALPQAKPQPAAPEFYSISAQEKPRVKSILTQKYGFGTWDAERIIDSITAPEDKALVNNIFDEDFIDFYKRVINFFYNGAHESETFSEVSELYDEIKTDPKLKDILFSDKYRQAVKYVRAKFNIIDLPAATLLPVLNIAKNLDEVKSLVEKLENEYRQRVSANDLYLLAQIARRPDLQSLLFKPEEMFEKVKELFAKEPSSRKNFDLKCAEFDVVKKLKNDHTDPAIVARVSDYVKAEDEKIKSPDYKERPTAEELKKWPLLNFLRLCALKEFLSKKDNLKALGKIAGRDFADRTTEYGGEFRFDKKAEPFIKNIKAITPSNFSYGNAKYGKLLNAAFTFHCHIMENTVKYTGPSSMDIQFMQDDDSTDVVITSKEKFKGADGKEYMRVNIDFYFVDKTNPRKALYTPFDMGDYIVELPK